MQNQEQIKKGRGFSLTLEQRQANARKVTAINRERYKKRYAEIYGRYVGGELWLVPVSEASKTLGVSNSTLRRVLKRQKETVAAE